MPDMVDSLPFRPLHADIFMLAPSSGLTLYARGGYQSNWRGVNVVVISFWDFEVDTIVSPWMDVNVTIASWIWIKTCPLGIHGWVLKFLCYALVLKASQLHEAVVYFLNSRSGPNRKARPRSLPLLLSCKKAGIRGISGVGLGSGEPAWLGAAPSTGVTGLCPGTFDGESGSGTGEDQRFEIELLRRILPSQPAGFPPSFESFRAS